MYNAEYIATARAIASSPPGSPERQRAVEHARQLLAARGTVGAMDVIARAGNAVQQTRAAQPAGAAAARPLVVQRAMPVARMAMPMQALRPTASLTHVYQSRGGAPAPPSSAPTPSAPAPAPAPMPAQAIPQAQPSAPYTPAGPTAEEWAAYQAQMQAQYDAMIAQMQAQYASSGSPAPTGASQDEQAAAEAAYQQYLYEQAYMQWLAEQQYLQYTEALAAQQAAADQQAAIEASAAAYEAADSSQVQEGLAPFADSAWFDPYARYEMAGAPGAACEQLCDATKNYHDALHAERFAELRASMARRQDAVGQLGLVYAVSRDGTLGVNKLA